MSSNLNFFDNISKLNILCIGDIMLDRFVYGKVERISPEAPVQILNINEAKEVLGGCGNVVANLESLGCKTTYLGIIGQDLSGRKVAKLLKQCGCTYKLLRLKDYSTIVKTRFIAGNNQILRIDEEKKLPLIKELLPRFESILHKAIKHSNLVLLSDYNKGIFTHETTQMIINLCKKYDKKVIVDPKGNDYTKYKGATFVKPNLKEFNEATGMNISPSDNNFEKNIKIGAKALFKKCKIENLLVTLSEHGMLLITSQNTDNLIKLPTLAKEVFDVSGAGDTTIATFSLGIALGLDLKTSMKLANCAAGIVVGKLGTACVYKEELIGTFNTIPQQTHNLKIKNINELIPLIMKLKKQGKTIGFTNGCFDLLHLGHLNSFAEAKTHCDILVVGINTDASVKRNKGNSRPFQDEKTRSNLVAAIEYVDFVVLFDEDSALQTVEKIKPDVIAKEGYKIKNWPEAQYVKSYGGKAITLSRLNNYSTTNFINNLKNNLR